MTNRRPLLLTLVGACLLAAFVLGLRWGLYIPPRQIDLVTYALMQPNEDPAITPATAVLYPNGRFAVLTNHFGYVGQKIDSTSVDAAFLAVEQASGRWGADYPSATKAQSVAVLRLTLHDGQIHSIRVEDPLTNPAVPRSLRSFLTTLTREQYIVVKSGAPIDPTSLPLRIYATPLASTVDPAIYALPDGYAIDPLLAPGGFAPSAGDALVSAWQLSSNLSAPANSRVVRVGDKLYRVSVLVDWPALKS